MNVYLPNLRLPSEYQEVEYIGRNGNNYIDSGWIPTTNFTVKIGYKIADSGYRYILLTQFGGPESTHSVSLEINSGSVSNNSVRFYCGSSSATQFYSSNSLNLNSFNDITITAPGTINLNGTTTTSSSMYTGSYGNKTCLLFVERDLTFSTYSHNSFISYCKIYEGSTLVRDFVPCYRKSDNVIGLYDLVNSVFYTNSGTGTFSKGNDVTMAELKNAYIGEYIPWTPDASRTLLYLPLESNTNDYSGNNRTCTPTSVTFTTVGGVQSAHVGTTGGIIVTPNGFVNTSLQYCTTSCLVYWTSAQTSNRRNLWEWAIQNTCSTGMYAYENSTQLNAYGGVGNNINTYVSDMVNKWTHIVMTIGNGTYKLYINGELKQNKTETYTYARGSRPNNYQQSQTVFNSRTGVSASQGLNGNAREIIFENILWSDEDVSKYYQRIKAKLGF